MYTETYEAFRKRFIRKLNAQLKKNPLTQREQILAGLDPAHIYRIKKGQKNLTLKMIWRISRAFGFDPLKLFR